MGLCESKEEHEKWVKNHEMKFQKEDTETDKICAKYELEHELVIAVESGCAVEFDQYLDNELVNRIGLEALLITHTTKPPHRSRFLPTPVVRKIADIIKTNQSLVFIRLTGHRFLKNDVECLLEAMEGHMALLELDLYGNNIESEAGLLFSDGLMKIPMLRRANIGGNMILAEERMQLKREFKENKAHFRVLV